MNILNLKGNDPFLKLLHGRDNVRKRVAYVLHALTQILIPRITCRFSFPLRPTPQTAVIERDLSLYLRIQPSIGLLPALHTRG